MIEYKIADKSDLDMLMNIRLEMLRIVNKLVDCDFDKLLVDTSREYFENGDQTTIIALDNGKAIGCASICFITVMPTFSHPNGKRAHVMNVYTNESYRRQGVAMHMMQKLMSLARERGVTSVSLDATLMGRGLYEKVGFSASDEAMEMCL